MSNQSILYTLNLQGHNQTVISSTNKKEGMMLCIKSTKGIIKSRFYKESSPSLGLSKFSQKGNHWFTIMHKLKSSQMMQEMIRSKERDYMISKIEGIMRIHNT
jgi:hypothetical protein